MKIENSVLSNQQRNCKNCQHHFTGNFCPNCGQKFLEGRFAFLESIGWIFNTLFNVERGFVFTIKQLTFKTNAMLTTYLNRATVQYMHPFRFAFVLATLSSILTISTGTFDSSSILQMAEGWDQFEMADAPTQEELSETVKVLELVKKYLSFILLLNIPIYAVATSLIYFRKKYNYTEHLILNCYALGFSLLIGFPVHFLMFLENGAVISSAVSPVLSIICFSFIYSRFFKENYFLSVLKIILGYVIFGLVLFLLGIVASFITFILNG